MTNPLQASGMLQRGWMIGPSVSVIWGIANEIVYDTSGVPNENDYLSLLTWELNPVVTLGFESQWNSGKGGGLDLKFRSAVPGMRVGQMNDFDWLYTDRDWSHWSVSDVNLRWGFILDAVYDWRVLNSGAFGLNIGVGYHLDWWAWRDSNRDSIYSDLNQLDSYYPGPFPIGDGYRTVPDAITVGVNGIDYETAYHIPLVSISLNFDWDIFFLYGSGRIGPAIAFSKDHHKLRTEYGPDGVYFYDSATGGPWIDVEMIFGFRTQGRFSFSLRGEYAWLNEIKGDTVTQYTDGRPMTLSIDSGGFSFSRIGVTTLASWNIGGP